MAPASNSNPRGSRKTYVTISQSGQGKVLSLTLNEQVQQWIMRAIGLRWLALMFPILVIGAAFLSQFHQDHLVFKEESNQSQLESLTVTMDSLSQVVYNIKEKDDFVRMVIGYDLIPEDIFKVGQGGPVSPEFELELQYNPKLRAENHLRNELSSVTARLSLLEESRHKVKDGLLKKLKDISHTPSILPAKGRLVSGYGVRFHPILHLHKHHAGIDIANKTNTDILSAANGQVIRAQYSTSFGNFVEVKHSDSITTLYAHMRSSNVSVGDKVFRGQVIGKMGNTGRSTGTHLHYEVRKRGHAVNPKYYFLPENKVYD